MQIFNCEQNSPEWYAVRLGVPTASNFDKIATKLKNGNYSIERRKYMLQLIAERLTGELTNSFVSHDMLRGKELEEKARELYSFVTNNKVEQVGFILEGKIGCSPDGLIGADGLMEIKCKRPENHLNDLLNDVLPEEHKAQVQGQLMISAREWCDFISYCPGLPIFIKRVEKDNEYHNYLNNELNLFIEELNLLEEKIINL